MRKNEVPTLRYQLILLRNLSLLLGILPAVAWGFAEPLTIDNQLAVIPTVVYIITMVSASLGGLAGTLHRVSKHLEPNETTIRHPKIFVAANMLGGLVAGWVMFFMSTHAGTPTLLVQGFVLMSSFGGAALVERFVDRYFPSPGEKG
jgi:hypothetical protein